MKILSFGSLNYDFTYLMDHFIVAKETVSALGYSRSFGGKGANQSIAFAKAGLEVYHAGKVGMDGQDYIDYLKTWNVNTDYIVKDDSVATGNAIIQLCNGENCIIISGGANQAIDEAQIDETLTHFEAGDTLVIQNEISNLGYLITKAHEKGLKVCFNTAPMDSKIFTYPLDLVDLLIVNEVEGKGLAGIESDEYEDIIEALAQKYPDKEVLMTMGGHGSIMIHGDERIRQEAVMVEAVDTTAAGDTFIGYFLAMRASGKDTKEALRIASLASSITVTRAGAAVSIPTIDEVEKAL